MGRTFKHLAYEQRQQIRLMLSDGNSKVDIATKLGCSLSAVYQEIRRGSVNSEYEPDYSEEQYRRRLAEKGTAPIVCIDPKLSEYIAHLILEEHMSLANIVDVLAQEKKFDIFPKSVQTIYAAIDHGLIPGVSRDSLHSKTTTVYNDQIHLVKWIRERMNISDGDVLHFEVVGDKLIFTKVESKGTLSGT